MLEVLRSSFQKYESRVIGFRVLGAIDFKYQPENHHNSNSYGNYSIEACKAPVHNQTEIRISGIAHSNQQGDEKSTNTVCVLDSLGPLSVLLL